MKAKQKFSKDINSSASKVDKREIVDVNYEWRLHKENKEVSTPTLKEAILLFLTFGSRSVERSERSSQQTLKIVFTGGGPRSLYFSYIWFDLKNSRSGFKAVWIFFILRLYHIHLFKKFIRKQGFLLNLHPDRRNLSIYEPTSLYFFLFQKSFNAHAICTRRCFCTTKNNFWFTDWPLTKAIVVRRELRSCPCSWWRDIFFSDRRHLLQQTFKEKLRRRNCP